MKWSIRQAVDVYFKAKSAFKLGAKTFRAGEPVLIFDSVKTSTIEVGSEVTYVTGGRDNARLLSYEGDKSLSFSFEEALLSAEGLAILSGADLINARNAHLPGSHPEARSVIAHYTEKYSISSANIIDSDAYNVYPDDSALYPASGRVANMDYSPRGSLLNVWLSKKPYVGQSASIYVMLLDDAGEISGLPVQVNLNTVVDYSDPTKAASPQSFLAKWQKLQPFIAFGKNGKPMPVGPTQTTRSIAEKYGSQVLADLSTNITKSGTNYSISKVETPYVGYTGEFYPEPANTTAANANYGGNGIIENNAIFDDQVEYYVDLKSAALYWVTAWGDIAAYIRQIPDINYGSDTQNTVWGSGGAYAYLLAPPGGIAQPVCFKEGSEFVYKVSVPSILYQDMTLLDYYVEYRHDATQVSILPDQFAPYMYVEGSSLVKRASDGIDLPVEFVIPKLKITTALTFTLTGTGDASTFTFQGDAYPDFSKFDLSRKVLADIQILDGDDNYDGASDGVDTADPTSYRRYHYNNDSDGEYIWKDPSIEAHQNLDYSDTGDYNADHGGPATITAGQGRIDSGLRSNITGSATTDVTMAHPGHYVGGTSDIATEADPKMRFNNDANSRWPLNSGGDVTAEE